jgi:hypothetical protein
VVVRAFLLVSALLVPAAGAVAVAHHSIAAIYDRNSPITLDGIVSEFRLVNPHAFLTMQVTRNSQKEVWKLELDNRWELADIGIKSDTLKPGDRVIAKGSGARDGSHTMYALRIDRPADGFWYEQVGSSPRVGRQR